MVYVVPAQTIKYQFSTTCTLCKQFARTYKFGVSGSLFYTDLRFRGWAFTLQLEMLCLHQQSNIICVHFPLTKNISTSFTRIYFATNRVEVFSHRFSFAIRAFLCLRKKSTQQNNKHKQIQPKHDTKLDGIIQIRWDGNNAQT